MSLKPFVPTQDQVNRNRAQFGSDYDPSRGGHYPKNRPDIRPDRTRKEDR